MKVHKIPIAQPHTVVFPYQRLKFQTKELEFLPTQT